MSETETVQEVVQETTQDEGSLLDVGADEGQKETVTDEPEKVTGKPDWLSDDLWDAKTNGLKSDAALKKIQDAEKHEKMAKDLRDKLARRGLPPEKPEDYKINLDDKPYKDAIDLPDAVMNKVKAAAHKLGISQAQFGPLADAYLSALAEMTTAEPTEEQKAAYAEAEKTRQESEIAKLGANGHQVIQAVSGMIRDMKAQGVITDAEINVAKEIAKTAAGVQFLNAMRERMGGDHVPMADLDPEVMGGVSHSAIQDLMNSDGYRRGDESVVAKVEKMIDQTIKAGNPFKYKI